MKKLLLILIALPMIGFGQNVNIPDANFKAFLVGNSAINTNGDNEIQVSEASVVNGLFGIDDFSTVDITGIQAFVSLDSLTVNSHLVTSIDVSNMSNLIYLNTGNSPRTSLNVNGCTALTTLDCSDNQVLTSLDVSQNTALTYLNCRSNQLTNLDVSNNTALTYLYCRVNQITSLDVSNNTALDYLDCKDNQLTSLTVSGASALEYLRCDENQLTSLNVSSNTALTNLKCGDNQITSLDVSGATALTYLNCYGNQLTNLDVNNTALETLDCTENLLLKCLDVSGATNLMDLQCNDMLLEQLNTKNGNWQNLQIDALNNNLTCVEVDNLGYANSNWVGSFDSFVTFSTNCNYTNPCTTVSAIQEHTTNKELLKVTDLLGRETKQTNQPLFYIYDDGTVEKRIVIE